MTYKSKTMRDIRAIVEATNHRSSRGNEGKSDIVWMTTSYIASEPRNGPHPLLGVILQKGDKVTNRCDKILCGGIVYLKITRKLHNKFLPFNFLTVIQTSTTAPDSLLIIHAQQ